jgi:hypothetical protein
MDGTSLARTRTRASAIVAMQAIVRMRDASNERVTLPCNSQVTVTRAAVC